MARAEETEKKKTQMPPQRRARSPSPPAVAGVAVAQAVPGDWMDRWMRDFFEGMTPADKQHVIQGLVHFADAVTRLMDAASAACAWAASWRALLEVGLWTLVLLSLPPFVSGFVLGGKAMYVAMR